MRRVPQEHNVLRVPPRVSDGGKPAPQRTVLEEAVPLQLLGEERLTEGQGGVFVVLRETGGPPGGVGSLDDERGAAGGILIGVNPPEPVWRFLEEEGEGWKRPGSTEPDEPIGPPLEARSKLR